MVTHHEAGHSVAALMTMHCVLDEIYVGAGGVSRIHVLGGPLEAGLVLYAGPWAEARRKWSRAPLSLDDTDGGGSSFRDMIDSAFEHASDIDGESDRIRYCKLQEDNPGTWDNEPFWSAELERAWPIIQKLAGALRDGLDNAEPDTKTLAVLNRTLYHFTMPGAEVVELVQPLLEDQGQWRYIE